MKLVLARWDFFNAAYETLLIESCPKDTSKRFAVAQPPSSFADLRECVERTGAFEEIDLQQDEVDFTRASLCSLILLMYLKPTTADLAPPIVLL